MNIISIKNLHVKISRPKKTSSSIFSICPNRNASYENRKTFTRIKAADAPATSTVKTKTMFRNFSKKGVLAAF